MRAVLLVLSLLCTSSCSSLRALHALKSHPRQMTLPLSALASDAPATLLHDVRMEIAGRPFSMIGTAELTPGSLTLAAVTSVGGRLFVIQYDGAELRYEPSHLIDVPIKPERMLRDFFLIYGQATDLVAYGLDVRQQDAGRRIVTRNGERISVSYTDIDHVWTSDVQYRNRRLGYSITISPIAD
jgi:hypothetical protein